MKRAVEGAVEENKIFIEEELRSTPEVQLNPRDIPAGFDGKYLAEKGFQVVKWFCYMYKY